VFGILEREGKVEVEIVKDVTAETLLREAIKKVKGGALYTRISSRLMMVW
jgi:transposase